MSRAMRPAKLLALYLILLSNALALLVTSANASANFKLVASNPSNNFCWKTSGGLYACDIFFEITRTLQTSYPGSPPTQLEISADCTVDEPCKDVVILWVKARATSGTLTAFQARAYHSSDDYFWAQCPRAAGEEWTEAQCKYWHWTGDWKNTGQSVPSRFGFKVNVVIPPSACTVRVDAEIHYPTATAPSVAAYSWNSDPSDDSAWAVAHSPSPTCPPPGGCPPLTRFLQGSGCVPASSPPPSPCDDIAGVRNADSSCSCLRGWVWNSGGWCQCQGGRCAIPFCPPGLTWDWVSLPGGGRSGGCGCPGSNVVKIGPAGPYCPPAGRKLRSSTDGIETRSSSTEAGPRPCPSGKTWMGGRCATPAGNPIAGKTAAPRSCGSAMTGTPPNCTPFTPSTVARPGFGRVHSGAGPGTRFNMPRNLVMPQGPRLR